MRLRFLEPDAHGTQKTVLEDGEILDLLRRGIATVDPVQHAPPFALLDLLDECLGRVSVFGPSTNEFDLSAKVSTDVFAHGIRQNFVEGSELNWHSSGRDFWAATTRSLCRCPVADRNFFEQARSVMREHLSERADRVTVSAGLSNEQLRRRHLVPRRTGNFLRRTRDYYELSQNWFEFYERHKEQEKTWNRVVRQALLDGRIIVSEATSRGDRFVPAGQTNKADFQARDAPYSFCFSSDLPGAWFATGKPLHIRRAWAGEWMVRVNNHFVEQGRRANAEDLKQVAMEKFHLSANGARKAKESVAEQFDDHVGRIPAEKKVKLSEIREIE